MPKEDRIRDLHHRRLQMQTEENPLFLAVLNTISVEFTELAGAHNRRIDHLTWEQFDAGFERYVVATGGGRKDDGGLGFS